LTSYAHAKVPPVAGIPVDRFVFVTDTVSVDGAIVVADVERSMELDVAEPDDKSEFVEIWVVTPKKT
jgi:hypothetical protein